MMVTAAAVPVMTMPANVDGTMPAGMIAAMAATTMPGARSCHCGRRRQHHRHDQGHRNLAHGIARCLRGAFAPGWQSNASALAPVPAVFSYLGCGTVRPKPAPLSTIAAEHSAISAQWAADASPHHRHEVS